MACYSDDHPTDLCHRCQIDDIPLSFSGDSIFKIHPGKLLPWLISKQLPGSGRIHTHPSKLRYLLIIPSLDTTHYTLYTIHHKLHTTDYRLQTTHYTLHTTHSKLHKALSYKALPVEASTGPWGCRRLRIPEVLDSRQMKVVKLSTLSTGHLTP